MENYQKRTAYCGLIDEKHLNNHVVVKGWVNKFRNLGSLLFIDLRDRAGIVQIIIEEINQQELFNHVAKNIGNEYVLEVHGTVRTRSKINPDIPTGKVEIVATLVNILNAAKPLPIEFDDPNVHESHRLTHRVIDLRSKKMQKNLILRHKVTQSIRHFLDKNEFIDIETPFLTATSPGGARDFLVPSRTNKGSCYALPQSPQIFKQLLMVAGFDRYYQIVRCFRDEELRADRQPEFTQVDIETSFLSNEEIMQIAEGMIRHLFHEVLHITVDRMITMSYQDAMHDYGVDKPDLRNPLKFIDLLYQSSDHAVYHSIYDQDVNKSNFWQSIPAFHDAYLDQNLDQSVIDYGSRIVALCLRKKQIESSGIELSRKKIDSYIEFVQVYGMKKLAYIKILDIHASQVDEIISSSLAKLLNLQEVRLILELTQAKNGDFLFIGAEKADTINKAMGALRIKLGVDFGITDNHAWRFLWVTDFPLFELSDKSFIATTSYQEKCFNACHHPFTSPSDDTVAYLATNPKRCYAKAYDMVLNGVEIGGGSIRIYDSSIQANVFNVLGMNEEEIKAKFGYLLENLQYGTPPHGGIAFGLDRIVAMICEVACIRDVIAFPKTATGQCLLTKSPSIPSKHQLDELGIVMHATTKN